MKKEIYTIIAALMCGACADKATYDACGTFEAEEILVSSQGTGQLVWFDVREGAQVEPGVVLGVVDTIQLHWQKVQLEAQAEAIRSARPDIRSQLSAIESQIATLKSEKQRIEKLVAKNAVPTKQLDDLNAQLQVLERQRVAQQTALSGNTSAADYNAEAIAAQIAIVEDRIAKCCIASPISGTVLAKYKSAGELVSMGTPLMKVANLDAMYLRAYFTSDQLATLNLGDEVEVTADFGGDQLYAYKGTVMWIASESEFTPKAIQTRNTRANLVYAVKIAVKNDGRLKVGMYGETKIIDN